MSEWLSRTARLVGDEAVNNLKDKRVAIFGIGGVGGYVAEALVRCGIGAFDLIDKDSISLSNINRQIIATTDTLGKYKVDVMKDRMLSINPDVNVRIYKAFFLPDNADEFPFEEYDYVVDCVDTVTAKLEIVKRCDRYKIPVISAMGAGNKLHPEGFKVADIYKTNVCPLAKVMRRELKKLGIKHLKVVYSEETAIDIKCNINDGSESEDIGGRKVAPGSCAFVPGAAGLIMAGEVFRDLIEI